VPSGSGEPVRNASTKNQPPATVKNHSSEFAGLQIYMLAPEVFMRIKETKGIESLYSGSRKIREIFD